MPVKVNDQLNQVYIKFTLLLLCYFSVLTAGLRGIFLIILI